MISETQLWWIIIGAAIATMSVRLLPFAALHRFRDNAYLNHIGQHLPLAVALALVVFTFKDIEYSQSPHGLPMVIATALCIVIYLWRGNVLLAIGISLLAHLLLVNGGIMPI